MAGVRPSATGAVLALATRLKAEGRDIISLGAGEPDFDTPGFVKDAAIAAITQGETKYTPIDGTAALKEAVRRKFAAENQLDYTPEQILVSSGAKQSLFNLCLALLEPGDEVVIPAPYWVSYPDMVRLAGAEPVIVNCPIGQDFLMRPEQLERVLSEHTRLLILNSPCNPTGAAYSPDHLAELGEVLAGHPEVVVASDDIYEHIYWGHAPFSSFATACPALYERTVTCNGVSKAYAMTGWRIGYAAGPAPLIRAMTTVQSQSTSNPCSISQAAAVAALEGDQACVREMAAAYRQRHDFFVAGLNAIEGFVCRPAEGTFYAFPDCSAAISRLGLDDDVALAEFLLDSAGVACVPGSAFGAPGHLRFSYACSQDSLSAALERINRAVSA
jgi:aspartate aminotransferase